MKTAARAPRTFTVRGWDGTEQTVTLASVFAEVRAFRTAYREVEIDRPKRSDLRKRRGKPRHRPILLNPEARMRKLGLETGYDTRRDVFLKTPLEPWTCPTTGGARLYATIMRGDDGATTLDDYSGDQITALEWMRYEQLIAVGDGGQVHALGDAQPAVRRSHPGAPVSDRKAAVGRQLRHRGPWLVLAAFANIVRRHPRKRISAGKRAAMDRPHGISIAAYDLCAEANAIKHKRRDLDGYRYLSVSTVRRIIRDLLQCGLLTETEPPRVIRVQRSWRTIPRVFAVPPQATAPELNQHRSRQKRRIS